MTDVLLRAAVPAEAGALSALALRSKAHWGYDEEFLATCREALTVRPADCDGRLVVAERDGQLLGFSRVVGLGPRGELSDLFVDPGAIGQGIGGLLLRAALLRAAAAGMVAVQLDSDPHAEPFYRYAGAVGVGSVPSSLFPGRSLPRMEFVLSAAGRAPSG